MANVFSMKPMDAGVPPKLLRKILAGCGLSIGARILVAGLDHSDLVSYLDEISFEVDGVDDSQARVDLAKLRQPRFDFHRLDDSASQLPRHHFDLILAGELDGYRGNLLDPSTRTETASLLASLKPRAHAVFIRHTNVHGQDDHGHTQACWQSHLASFPVSTQLTMHHGSWLQASPWAWLRALSDPGYFVAVARTPLELIRDDQWREAARRRTATCCVCQQTDTQRRAA